MIEQLTLRRIASFAVAVAAIFRSYGETGAATIISSFNSPMIENFDAFDGSDGTIPSNFTWVPDAGTTAGGLYDSAGSYSNNNRWYALYHSPTSTTDRAFGTKRQPNTTPDILTWSFVNESGENISKFDVTWDVEQYARGNCATAIDLDYNPNGAGPTQAGIVGTTLTVATIGSTVGENLANPIITSRSVTITLATPLANGQSIDFRWATASGLPSNGNAHIGVDNLSVVAVRFVPECSTACISAVYLAMGGLTVRRKYFRRMSK